MKRLLAWRSLSHASLAPLVVTLICAAVVGARWQLAQAEDAKPATVAEAKADSKPADAATPDAGPEAKTAKDDAPPPAPADAPVPPARFLCALDTTGVDLPVATSTSTMGYGDS